MNENLATAEGVKAHMSAAASWDDWNERAAQIITANGGKYPDFWFDAWFIELAHSKAAEWNKA